MTLDPRRRTPIGARLLGLGMTAAVAAAGLSACGGDDGTPNEAASTSGTVSAAPPLVDPAASQLDRVRAATAAFANVDAAKAAGYTVWSPDPSAPTPSCPSAPEGKMGYHLVNPALRGAPAKAADADAVIDAMRPEQLLYQRRADGSMELVGVEYLVFKAAWERVNGAGAPSPQVLGRPVPLSTHSFASGGPEIPHYELHVWLHSDNPNGMFAPYNPNIAC